MKPLTTAERARAKRLRRKLGLQPVALDLSADDLTRALVANGFALKTDAGDFQKIRNAASRMMRGLISHILSRRDAKNLQRDAVGIKSTVKTEPKDCRDAEANANTGKAAVDEAR